MTRRGMGSEAEPVVSLAVVLQILPGIFEPHPVLLQEAVECMARFEAEGPPQLGSGEFAFAVLFKGDGFEGGAGEVGAGGGESGRQLVGKVDGDLHGASIAEVRSGMR